MGTFYKLIKCDCGNKDFIIIPDNESFYIKCPKCNNIIAGYTWESHFIIPKCTKCSGEYFEFKVNEKYKEQLDFLLSCSQCNKEIEYEVSEQDEDIKDEANEKNEDEKENEQTNDDVKEDLDGEFSESENKIINYFKNEINMFIEKLNSLKFELDNLDEKYNEVRNENEVYYELEYKMNNIKSEISNINSNISDLDWKVRKL